MKTTYINRGFGTTKKKQETFFILRVVRSWLFKRIMLNIIWLLISFAVMICGAALVSKYIPELLIVWLLIVLCYGLAYSMICEFIFDAIIGDGYDW
jgi:hypothetical protein